MCFCSAETNDRSRFNFLTNSISSSLEDITHLSKKNTILCHFFFSSSSNTRNEKREKEKKRSFLRVFFS